MMKLVTTLLASALLLTSAAAAQNPQQNELPSAPMPHFPGAPLQQPAKAPAAVETAPQLTTLPPANAPAPVASHTPTTQPPPVNTQPATAAQTPAQNAPAAEPTMQASSTAPPADEGEFRIGVEVNLVNLIFTATDKRGHLIKDLKQSDIRLLDQGKPPESIKAFQSETGLPLQVGLLIDASNSIRDRFRFEQEAAAEFLNQVVRTESDKAFVIGFDSVADLTQDFTSDKNALGHGVRVLRAGGGTALHDAVYMACEKLAKAPVQNSARRALIVLSDGDDNQSRHTREQAIEAALRAEVIIYVINTDVSDMNQKGDKVLMRYAEATGGRVLNPLRIEDVTNAFNQIQDELRSQYVLAYKPGDFVANGSYRSITLDVPKRSNIKVRVRKGYYAPKGS
jgi:VWFA-related protein